MFGFVVGVAAAKEVAELLAPACYPWGWVVNEAAGPGMFDLSPAVV